MTDIPIEIIGMSHDLDNNRKVFVGQTPGDSTVYLKFSNGELKTTVRLTFEAANALRELLGSTSEDGVMVTSMWVAVPTAGGTEVSGAARAT